MTSIHKKVMNSHIATEVHPSVTCGIWTRIKTSSTILRMTYAAFPITAVNANIEKKPIVKTNERPPLVTGAIFP